jgi:2-polyprenyl-3-methyl-5-hydroxy-6-metoxy-1,4-benzoquinol methylase
MFARDRSTQPRIAERPAMASPSAVRPGWPYVDKDDPWSSHVRIKARLDHLPAGARVLDVGAATGTLGRMCAGKGLVLRGVEPGAEWAALAEPYYDALLCGTLEQAPDAFLSRHNAVVCADVIEHMAAPDAVLRRLLALQPEGCVFIISVPNVANVWVRLNLLLGRFDYADRGILDRTHLRFFTRRSLVALLETVGLQLIDLDVTPVPLNLVHPWFWRTARGRLAHRQLDRLTRRFPTLLGYQFVAQALKPFAG